MNESTTRRRLAMFALMLAVFIFGATTGAVAIPAGDPTPLAVTADGGICIVQPDVAASAGVRTDEPVEVAPPRLIIADHGRSKQVDRVRDTATVHTSAGRQVDVPVVSLRPCWPVEREQCTTDGGVAVGSGERPVLVWLDPRQPVEVAVPMVFGPAHVNWFVINGAPYSWTFKGPLVSCALVARPGA